MALRPIIDLEVNSGGLDATLQKIERMHQLISTMPSLQGGGGGGGGGRGGSQVERDAPYLDRAERAWRAMAEHSKAVVQNVREIAQRMLHITSMMSLITGAVTGFGFLGFESLARAATQGRMAALGANTTFGGLGSAQGAFGTYGNVQQMLTAVANAQVTPGQGAALQQLFPGGVPRDPGQMMMQLMRRAGALYRQFGAGAGAMWEAIPGLSGIVSLEQARRYSQLSEREIAEQGALYQRFRGRTEVSDEDLRKYQRFVSVIDLAGKSIEATFIRLLGPLAPSLESLTKAFLDLLEGLLKHSDLKGWIDSFASTIEHWAKELDKPEVRQGIVDAVTNFITKLEDLADAIGNVAGIIARLFGGSGASSGSKPAPQDAPGMKPAIPGYGFDPHGRWRWQNPDGSWSEGPPTAPSEGPTPGGSGTTEGHRWKLTPYGPWPGSEAPMLHPIAPLSPINFGGGRLPGQMGGMQPIPVMPWPLPLPVEIVEGPGGLGGFSGGGLQRASFSPGARGGARLPVGGLHGGGGGGPPDATGLPGDYSWGDYGTRANNPGNLNWAAWENAAGRFSYTDPHTGGRHSMAIFRSMEEGVSVAYQLLVRNQRQYGMTLAGALHGWAEHSYIGTLASKLGIDPNAPLDIANAPPELIEHLMQLQFGMEGRKGSHTVTPSQIFKGIGLARHPKLPVAPPSQPTPSAPAMVTSRQSPISIALHLRNETGGSPFIAASQIAT